jgi:hypothetical protein
MLSIYKYVIEDLNNPIITLPIGFKILSVASQRDDIVVYALVNINEPVRKDIKLSVVATGQKLDDLYSNRNFLGTVSLMNGLFMFHIFY